MKGWREKSLKDITVKIGSGATPRGGDTAYEISGISLIRSQNVLDFKFSQPGLVFINDVQAYELRNVTVKKNDILLNITGDSVARCCVVSPDILPARVNQHVAIVRVDNSLADYKFIFYSLLNLKEELLLMSEVGATRKALTKGMLENLQVNIPGDTNEQKAIAAVLGSLDDKIDLLHRQNATLEAMAEALFKQWFVVEAKEEWEEGTIGDILQLNYGKALSENNRTGAGFPVIGSSGVVGYHSEALVVGPGLVTGRKGTLGKVILLHDNFFPIDTTFYVTSKLDSFPLYYFYFLLRHINLGDMNSDSAVPGLNRDAAHSLEILLAPEDLIMAYNKKVTVLFKKILSNQTQIRTLEKLRDTLLPKLMSGEVRVEF